MDKQHIDFLRVIFIGAFLVSLSALGAAGSNDPLKVRVKSGILVGSFEDGARTFKNIPFAAPPVGKLRWAPPQPPLRWDGERAADKFGHPCTQLDVSRMSQAKRVLAAGVWIGAPLLANGSEDCLSLNIWAPEKARKAPVVVYFYGAGGSSDMPYWNGAAFARDGIVFVNFNYRSLTQGRFAHPALTKVAKPNEPLSRFDTMDQLAALYWVQENIAAFGGDPKNVTIAGVSAGGAAVLQLLTLPRAKGLFQKAAVESGVGWWAGLSQAEFEQVGVIASMHAGLPKDATVEQLRALRLDALPQLGVWAWDNRLFPMPPTETFAGGRAIDVPLLIGWNSFDGSSLRSGHAELIARMPPSVLSTYGGENQTQEDLAYALWTDVHVAAPARWIAKKTAGGAPTYVYCFSYVPPDQRGKVRGAAHASELPYVFDNWQKSAPGLEITDDTRAATKLVHSCWVSFARSGRPSCDGAPEWPRYRPEDDRIMELGSTAQVRKNFRKAQLDAQEAAIQNDLAAQRQELDQLLKDGFQPPSPR
jgi:para-nitrobenzyl esterase